MSTDDGSNQSNTQQSQADVNQPSNVQYEPQTPNPIQNVVNVMQSVDTTSPEAKLNATSMDDNNGGRIKFNEEIDSKKV